MSRRRRTGRKLLAALLPVALLIALAIIGLTAWTVYGASHPPRRAYLITPEKFSQLSERGLRATEEVWTNPDGTGARGWVIRGREGAPAVLLLHHYGADRSWLFNLGVKLNETTDMTVLLPDLRGHGENPAVASSSFGSAEAGDAVAALEHLQNLKSPQGRPLVGKTFGVYGVEMGAYAALAAAQKNPNVRALALDSVPDGPDVVLSSAVKTGTGFDNEALQQLAKLGARIYFLGDYHNKSACTVAEGVVERQVLLLSGEEAGPLRGQTEILSKCFPATTTVEARTTLPLTGIGLAPAAPEQGESYDRRVIEFFERTLTGLSTSPL
jgi:pimeloyl-ACP methyl ester carboxylesterase